MKKTRTRFFSVLLTLCMLLTLLPTAALAATPSLDGTRTIYYWGEDGFREPPAGCQEPMECETAFDSGNWYCYAYYQGDCTHTSYWMYRCMNCGRENYGTTGEYESFPINGNDPIPVRFELLESDLHDWVYTQAPTTGNLAASCTQNAIAHVYCKNCNKYLMENGTVSDWSPTLDQHWAYVQIPGTALGHDYSIGYTDATCTATGKRCSRCGEVEPALGHDYATPATCTEVSSPCTRCGTLQLPLGHTLTAATCTNPQTCVVCGATVGDVLPHSITTPATCTVNSSQCTGCGHIERALGHNWAVTPKVGLENIHCSRCSETSSWAFSVFTGAMQTLTPGEDYDLKLTTNATEDTVTWSMMNTPTLPAGMTMALSADGHLTGHVPDEASLAETGISHVNITVTADIEDSLSDAEKPYYTGAATQAMTIYLGGHNYQVGYDNDAHYTYYYDAESDEDVVVQDTRQAHSWALTATTPAACDTAGFDRYDCTGCNAFKQEPIPALGHDYSVYDSNDSFHWKACSRCNNMDAATEEAHNKDICVNTTLPTDSEDGLDTYYCSVCGTQSGTGVAETTNHIHTAYAWYRPSTEEHSLRCTGCGKTFYGPEAHTYSDTYRWCNLIHEGEGIIRCYVYKTCKICNWGYSENRFTATKSADSCTHSGTVYILQRLGIDCSYPENTDLHYSLCVDCGTVLSSGKHIAGQPTVLKEATATEDGVQATYCAVCDAFIGIEYIPCINHQHYYPAAYRKNATSHWRACPCGEVLAGTKGEHTEGSGTVSCYPTATQNGVRDYRCETCGYLMRTEVIPATGYTVTLDAQGGTAAATVQTTYSRLSALPTATRDGYRLTGWFDGNIGGTQITTATNFTHDTTIYAQWTAAGSNPGTGTSTGGSGTVSYTLSFNANGGSAIATVSKSSGTTVDLSAYAPTRSGYTFAGWYSDGALTKAVTSVKLTANTTVYAKWTKATALPFTDVPEDAWYHDDVAYAYEHGLFAGTSDTTFSPNAPMTRQMLWTVLGRLDGQTLEGSGVFDAARTWAMGKGITDGSNPGSSITREQLVTILWRYAGSPKSTGGLSKFTDGDTVASYAKEAMAWAVENGIVGGTSATTLTPGGPATRAQVAAILRRFAGLAQ